MTRCVVSALSPFRLGCLIVLWVSLPLAAQVSNASVSGVVRDPTGRAVPGAQITLHNVATNVERHSVTNSTGQYQFLQVPPGTYTLAASQTGFQTSRIEPFTLTVNQAAAVDVSLTVGQVQQSVTVEATGEAVEATSAGLGGTVTEKQVIDLPLNGRDFTQLLTLSPGVSPISVGQDGGGGEAAVTIGSNFVMSAINGQTNRSTFYMTDGIINAGYFFGTFGVAPIIDTLQEFKVNSHPDEAEFGGALGGTVNAVTKSGTNKFHGDAWEFIRNDAFDARNTFLSGVTPYKQNQFGFTFGGPVIIPKLYNGRDKTFFFGGMEWFRYRQPAESFLLVPTASELSGDLSDIGTPLYNPFTTRPDPSKPGQFLRDPFPGNRIPASLINPGMVAYAKQVLPPIQNVGVLGKNAIDTTPTVQDMRTDTVRVDEYIGDKNYLWFRYSDVQQDTTQSGGLPSLHTAISRPGLNYGVSYVRTFNPTTTMQLQFGHLSAGQNSTTRLPNGLSTGLAQTIGFSSSIVNYASGDTLLPSITVPGYFTGGEAISLEPSLEDVYQYKGSAAKVFGNHTLSFGAEWDSTNYESYYEYGFLTYSGQETGNPENSAQVGSPLASYLLGVIDYAAQRNAHETFRSGGVFGAYVQDAYRFRPNLTFNLGLRYDLTLINPYGKESSIGQPGSIETGDLNLNTGAYILQKLAPSCAERGHAPCIPGGALPAGVVLSPNGKLLHNTYTNLGPRIGIAYRLGANTAIRTGFGIFYDNWAGTAQRAQSFAGNWPDVALRILPNLNHPTAAQPTPSVPLQDPLGGNLPTPTPFGRVQRYVDPYMNNPYSMQWNFSVQHQFGPQTVLEVAYVGSGSRRLSLADYTNVALTPGPDNPVQRQLYPDIHSTYFETSSGNSEYDALQVQFSRRYSAGFQYQIAYTWSKAIDVGCSGFFGVEGCSVQDPYHVYLDRGVSGFNVPHLLSASILYELPIGTGKLLTTHNRPADYILGNWQINTLTTARSGQPFSVTYSADVPNTGNLGVRGNIVGDPHLSNPTRQEWFNKSAFAVPPLYTFGTSARNILRSQAFWNVDLSVFRSFPFGEGRDVEFRAEAFNVTNTAIYGVPNAALGTPAFATVSTTANNPRVLQLGLKVVF